jgi:hypothetical protein
MARELLQTLIDDVDRLLPAGGTAAAGDERLRRHSDTLRNVSRHIPALGALADATERVCQTEPEQVGKAWLDLIVLARQARVGSSAADILEGEITPLPPSGPWTTGLPADQVYSVAVALRGDRREVDHIRTKGIDDLRLWPMVRQLLDRWGDLGNLMALQVIPEFGRAALPFLESDLNIRHQPGAGRRLGAMALIDFESAVQVCLRLLPPEPGILGLVGKLGRPVVELFVAVLANPHGNYANWELDQIAENVLLHFEEEAVPLLLPALRDPDPSQREIAIQSLIRLGRSAAASALPDLESSLRDDAASVRLAACRALAQLGRSAARAYPSLIAVLGDRETDIQEAAAEAIKALGTPRAEVVPALIGVLDHAREQVRLVIVGALGKVAPRSQAAQKALTAAEKRERSPAVQRAIERLLWEIGCKR